MLKDSVDPHEADAAIVILPQPPLNPPRLEIVEACNLPFTNVRSHNLQADSLINKTPIYIILAT